MSVASHSWSIKGGVGHGPGSFQQPPPPPTGVCWLVDGAAPARRVPLSGAASPCPGQGSLASQSCAPCLSTWLGGAAGSLMAHLPGPGGLFEMQPKTLYLRAGGFGFSKSTVFTRWQWGRGREWGGLELRVNGCKLSPVEWIVRKWNVYVCVPGSPCRTLGKTNCTGETTVKKIKKEKVVEGGQRSCFK